MKKALFAILSLVFIFLACKKEEPVTAKFWPFAEGNKWTTSEDFTYNVQGFPPGSGISTTTNEVDSLDEMDDGKLVWPVTSITVPEGQDSILTINYYHVTEDSVYTYSLKTDTEPLAVEPNDLALGVKWEGTLTIPLTLPIEFPTELPASFEVVGSETVTVEAGTFNCVVIEIDLPDYNVDSAATQWRAEGIGMVKMTTNFTTTYSLPPLTFDVDIEGTSEMTSYDFQ